MDHPERCGLQGRPPRAPGRQPAPPAPPPTHPDTPTLPAVRTGSIPGARVPVKLIASPRILGAVVEEAEREGGGGGFTPAVEQLSNVATLPGGQAGWL